MAYRILVSQPGMEREPSEVKVLVAQLCPTSCDPMDCSPPGSSIHGILQARILDQVAISYSRGIFLTWGLNLVSPALAGRFFTTAPPGEPKTGVLRFRSSDSDHNKVIMILLGIFTMVKVYLELLPHSCRASTITTWIPSHT